MIKFFYDGESMKNKNGFVFIETIIAIIILMFSFLTLFNMYNKIYRKLDNRYSYDNLGLIYKANIIKSALDNYSDFKSVYKNIFTDDKLIINIGIESEIINFKDKENYMNVLDELKVSNVFLIKDLQEYKKECLNDYLKSKCSYITFNSNMTDYLTSITNKNLEYVLLIETRINEYGTTCYEESELCSPEYTYLEIHYSETSEINKKLVDILIESDVLWQSNLEGDGYRYVGSGGYNTNTSPENFICFGTTSMEECKANEEKYLYRIIGVFPDEEGNQHIKLKKFNQLNQIKWNNEKADVNWQDSTLYENLNGSYFLTNTKYEYLQNAFWLNKIENWKWTAVNTKTASNSGPNYYNTLKPSQIYLHEMNRSIKTSSVGEWTHPKGRIGLIYASDYALSLGIQSLSISGSTYDNREMLKTGWLNPLNNGGNHEWTMARFGFYIDTYEVWDIDTSGAIDGNSVTDTLNVSPVFYLTSNIYYKSGNGSYNNPYIILEK